MKKNKRQNIRWHASLHATNEYLVKLQNKKEKTTFGNVAKTLKEGREIIGFR